MSLTTRIEQDYIAAYKAKDALRLGVLRLLKTAAKNLQVELMRPVTDEELATVVQKQAKQRQDSIEQFTAANRPDLAEKEAAELSILKDYLPEPLSEEELAAAIDAAIADVKAGKTGPVPRELQNVHADGTGFEREQGYKYPHSYPGHWVQQQYLPDELKGKHYYEYGDNKTEQAARAYWQRIKGE